MRWLWILAACSGDSESTSETSPEPSVETVGVDAIPLARVPTTTISVPPRSGDGAIPTGLSCGETLEYVRTKNGVAEYKTPTPIRWTPVLGTGMDVRGPDGQEMVWEEDGQLRLNTWRSTARWVILRLPEQGQTIAAGECQITSPQSMELEAQLNLDASGMPPAEFVARAIDRDNIMRTGLLVPAPGSLTWDLTVPEDAVFSSQGSILSSEFLGGTPSDGATAVVSVTSGEETTEVLRTPLQVDTDTALHADLSAWAGKPVTVTLQTDPGETTDRDYVFFAEPMISAASERPRQVVLIYVDTLRPDHLSHNGYARETSPKTDAWAAGATRFGEARSVASWTLPSAQATLSGVQPEEWGTQPNLAEILSESGFFTAAFVANINLTPSYDMGPGWSHFAYGLAPEAGPTIDAGLAVLSAHADRDVAVMFHFMEPHLPYTEPEEYRTLWAGPHPSVLPEEFKRSDLLGKNFRAMGDGQPEVQQYTIDRYDQNIRYLDEQLARIYDALHDDAVVVFFSDHGEEFWEHGGFEHGHTLYDETVRVALTIQAPGMPAGDVDAPVSLLDVTPTILDVLDLPPGERIGMSLAPLANGDADVETAFRQRPQAMGRMLHSGDAWAVLQDRQKWISAESIEQVFDLENDPGELSDMAATQPDALSAWHKALSEALGIPVADVWRLSVSGPVITDDAEIVLSHPAGFSRMWTGYDIRGRRVTDAQLVDGVLRIHHTGGERLPFNIYVVPNDLDPTGLTLTFSGPENLEATYEGGGRGLVTVKHNRTRVLVSRDVVPHPEKEAAVYDLPGLEDQLRALGYVE